MNILVSDSWLREFIDTKATPQQIGECLSLCSQSVEKITPNGKDFVYDIEITTNRPDCLSVYGIARELSAILPMFNIKAQLQKIPSLCLQGVTLQAQLPLQVKISKEELCPRFTALIYDNITIKPSPKYIQERLNQSGIRALNNVIDISNYLMLELGQPMHTFDYDKILRHKMFLRESKEGEEIITLDGQKRKLPSGVIVIEDGEGRIVDLCGIMGAKNSETDEKTKRVLLFVQTYNPMKIRSACQALGFRTEAASRFEKGIDPEGVIPAMKRATLLFKEWCGTKPASKLFDIYPKPAKEKTVSVNKQKLVQTMGVDLNLKESTNILKSLGFETRIDNKKEIITATVPHWRNGDIDIPEDLVEEISRIYGYHNLPNVLPPITTLDYQRDPVFEWEDKIKNALKYWGFTEVMSYSLVHRNLIDDDKPLKIANPLTEDLVYLRTSLINSLLDIINKNQRENEIKVFEMANIYLQRKKDELPEEIMTLVLAMTGEERYLEMKGILEALLRELGIEKSEIKPGVNNVAEIFINGVSVGIIGEIAQNQKVTISDLRLKKLLEFATQTKKYTPLPKYPAIIEDLSFVIPQQTYIGPIIEAIKKANKLIKSVEILDSYKGTKTFRITYQSNTQNLTDKETGSIREKIIENIRVKFGARLKS